MYPKAAKVEKGVIRRALDKGLGFIRYIRNIPGDTEAEGAFDPPSTEEMVKQCLHFYLEPSKNILLAETHFPQNFILNEFVREIKHIFQQHNNPVVQHNPSSPTTVSVDNLKEVRSLYV